MKKLLTITGIIVCFGVAKISAQSCCGNPSVLGNGENILNFTTLCKKKVVLDLNTDYTTFKPTDHQNDTQGSSHDHHNHNHNHATNMQHSPLQGILLSTAQVRYGLHDRVTVQAQMPLWLVYTPEKHAFILGDVPLLATYKIAQGENYGIASTAGLELPTGANYVVFENNYLVTGSGSLDPILGASFWFKYKKFITRIQTQYRQGMKGFDNIRFGSSLNTQWIVAYYLKGLETESKLKLNLNTGLNQDWTEAHSLNQRFIDNTGSFVLWYHTGTQIQYKKWLFPFSFTVPVFMQLRGMQNEPHLRMRTGVTLLF